MLQCKMDGQQVPSPRAPFVRRAHEGVKPDRPGQATASCCMGSLLAPNRKRAINMMEPSTHSSRTTRRTMTSTDCAEAHCRGKPSSACHTTTSPSAVRGVVMACKQPALQLHTSPTSYSMSACRCMIGCVIRTGRWMRPRVHLHRACRHRVRVLLLLLGRHGVSSRGRRVGLLRHGVPSRRRHLW